MRSLATTILAVLCLLPPAALAQSGRTIKFRAVCFRHEKKIDKVLVPAPGEKGGVLEVPLYTSGYSDQMQMKTKGGVAVFSVENPDSKSEEDLYLPVGTARVPASTPILFVFLPPAKGSKLPYRVMALPDDLRAFPWQGVRMLNIATVPAKFHLGEYADKKAITVAPGKIKAVPRVRKLNKYNRYNVLIEFKGKNGFVGVSNTRWSSVKGKRDLAIAYIDPKTHRPVVSLYSDVQPAELP